jgi:putative redox protein
MADEYGATLRWVEGLQFVGRGLVGSAAMVLDGPTEHGGANSGVRPMEALLLSLGGCTGMDVIAVLLKKRQAVTAFWINVSAQRAAEHPRAYERIQLEFVVRGHGVDPAAVQRAIELSQTKYCGVTASLKAEITYTFRVEEEGAKA